MSKQTLINSLLASGKKHSWEEYAVLHGLANGEVARGTWKAYRKNNSTNKTKVNNSTNINRSGDKITFNPSSTEQANYISDLEQQIVELVDKIKVLPKTAAFNIGHQPLDYSLELQKEVILREMRNNSTRVRRVRNQANNTTKKNCLVELSIFDLHIGKLAWDKETNDDYDIDIAVKRYKDSVMEIMSRINTDTIERILLPIGNDMINVDGKHNTTTSGTPQSCDSRFGKMFRAAKDLVIDTVNWLSEIAPVDIMVIPGNHDEVTMFTLGEVLDAWYYNNEDVAVFNSPKLRKYYQYGLNMIMFTHGDKEKHSDLGLIAASEEAKMWGETKFREAHIGHLHKSKNISYTNVDEFQGYKVRILPSLSGTDAWHHSKGYISQKSAKAFVWHKEAGLITEHTYNVI